MTAAQVAERAGFARSTLYLVEKGNPKVAIGGYFSVLGVLHLQVDFLKLGTDDVFGCKLRDLEIYCNKV